jgi:chromodomain-helicase-DNA-binding protein 4
LRFGREGVKLLDYQVEGVRWLLEAWDSQRNVILADEMGLGKTIQTIVFLRQVMFTQKITRPFLIAVPLSVLENWRREFSKWLPEANVLIFNGSKESRRRIEELEFFFDLTMNGQQLHVPKFNVLLTSYDSLRADFLTLAPFEWQALIIDEGQRMKNNNSRLFTLLQQLRV